jgi:hypothetical protein
MMQVDLGMCDNGLLDPELLFYAGEVSWYVNSQNNR